MLCISQLCFTEGFASMPGITDLFWNRETEAGRGRLVAAWLAVRPQSVRARPSPGPHILAQLPSESQVPLLLRAAGAWGWVFSGWRLLTPRVDPSKAKLG